MIKLVGTPEQIKKLVSYYDGGSDHKITVISAITSNLNYHQQKALGLLGYPATSPRALMMMTTDKKCRLYDGSAKQALNNLYGKRSYDVNSLYPSIPNEQTAQVAIDYQEYLSGILDPRD